MVGHRLTEGVGASCESWIISWSLLWEEQRQHDNDQECFLNKTYVMEQQLCYQQTIIAEQQSKN